MYTTNSARTIALNFVNINGAGFEVNYRIISADSKAYCIEKYTV